MTERKKVTDTDTTNKNPPQQLLINQTLPIIIPPIEPPIADVVASGRGITHAIQTIDPKVIVKDAACSGAHVFRDPADVKQKDTDKRIPWERNTLRRPPRLIYAVMIDGGTTVPLTITGNQDIISPRGFTGPVEIRNAQIFYTSINGNSTKNWDPTPNFSKVIVCKISDNSSAYIYLRCWVNFTHGTRRAAARMFSVILRT